jgi:hypothetical protein
VQTYPRAITVRWPAAVETIALPSSVFSGTGQVRTSEESWIEEGRQVSYRTSSRLLREKNEAILEVEYREHSNPRLAGEIGCWGVSRLRFSPGQTTGQATWHEQGARGHPTRGRWWAVPLAEDRRRVQVTRAERQQTRFREELRAFESCCAVSGESLPEALEAAHILSVKRGGLDVPQNGILLRADLHRLLDAGYLAIDKSGNLKLLKPVGKHYEELISKKKRLNEAVVQRIRPFLRLC